MLSNYVVVLREGGGKYTILYVEMWFRYIILFYNKLLFNYLFNTQVSSYNGNETVEQMPQGLSSKAVTVYIY